jgi:putative transposase
MMHQSDRNLRRYVFKLYPRSDQAEALHCQRRMMADLWNALKQRQEDTYRREHRSLSFFDLTNEITELRHECPEWAEVPAVTAHRVAKHLTESYAAFFRRVKRGEAPGYPRWQRRDKATTIPLGTMDKTGWHIERNERHELSWRLHYKSVTPQRDRSRWLHARGRLPAPVEDWRNADIIWRNGSWWLSVCVVIEPRRSAGCRPTTVRLDLIDEFSSVDERTDTPDELLDCLALDDDVDLLKSERDRRWPRGRRLDDEARAELAEANAEIAALYATIARKRRNALHVWSSRIVANANDLTVIAPKMGREIATPHGDVRVWGANTATASAINRRTLAQAPSAAVQMLKYKAVEAGIRFDVIDDVAAKISVARDIVTTGKQLRRARREARRIAA